MTYSKLLYPSYFVWNETKQKYIVTIEADAIGFDSTQHFGVVKVLRKNDADSPWRNVVFQYEIDNSGNLLLYFDVIFTGKVTVLKDE